MGVLKRTLDFSLEPKDNTIHSISPLFSIRLDSKKLGHGYTIYGSYDGYGFSGAQEFNSVYYKEPSEIRINLIGCQVEYKFTDSKIYNIDKNNLPIESTAIFILIS
jgi:hypothetical protein